jgi:hypothetical protein
MIFSGACRFGSLLVRTQLRRVLLFGGLVFAALPAGSALADTTVGQTGTPAGGFGGGAEIAQNSATMPAAGTVTSFHTQSAVFDPDCHVGVYDFQVLRPLGNNQYTVLGDTGDQVGPCDGALHSNSVSIPVKTGDVLGVYVVNTWQGALSTTSGSLNADLISEPAVGDTVTLSTQVTATVDESATLVPSASVLAATLVTDSTGVGPGRALFAKASAIQTAVSSGQTATACVDITNYLGLVNSQSGKKLTATKAATLTTDADNLAAALRCS